jgi:hypothetical protein
MFERPKTVARSKGGRDAASNRRPSRHIPTLPKGAFAFCKSMSASTSCGHPDEHAEKALDNLKWRNAPMMSRGERMVEVEPRMKTPTPTSALVNRETVVDPRRTLRR